MINKKLRRSKKFIDHETTTVQYLLLPSTTKYDHWLPSTSGVTMIANIAIYYILSIYCNIKYCYVDRTIAIVLFGKVSTILLQYIVL